MGRIAFKEGIVNPFWMTLFWTSMRALAAGKAREAWKEREDFLEKLTEKDGLMKFALTMNREYGKK